MEISLEEKKAIERFKNLGLKSFREEKIKNSDKLSYIEYVIILNLIEKQQKEIEEYKKVLECIEVVKDYNLPVVKNESLKEDISFVLMSRKDFLRNWGGVYISKQKIKDKIDELEDRLNNECIAIYEFQLEAKINLLQELLEE